MSNAPTVRQFSGVRVPVNVDEMFLNTLMQLGPPPPAPPPGQKEWDDGGEAAKAYFMRCMRFWRELNCTGDPLGFQHFFNTKYIKWLNHNHEIANAKQS